MRRSFGRVIEGEGKKVTEEAVEYLAKAVDGSFRDGVKILDLVLGNSDKVELADIEQIVSGSAGYTIVGLADALASKDVTLSLAKLNEATSNGVDVTYLLVSLMRALRDKLLSGEVEIEATKLIFSLDEVARRLATSLDGELLIQVAMVEWCSLSDGSDNRRVSESVDQKISKPVLLDNQKKQEVKEEAPKSSWAAMKEKIKSGKPIATSDTIDEAMAIFSS
jgi:DNA polymerase III gamma/tau subunit